MDSPEYKTLTQYYPRLFTCIQQSPSDIVTQLRPSGILAPEDLSFLDNPQNSKNQKAQRILHVALTQVEIDPGVFRTFVSALEAAGSWTSAIVSELNNLYTSLSTTTSMTQAPLHVDSTIQTQASQNPTSMSDHEPHNQPGRDLYEGIYSQSDSDTVEFDIGEAPLQETRHMRRKFAGLICKVINSIKKAKVEVQTLATYLDQCSLFSPEVYQSIKNGDVDNVFTELKYFYSWLDFDLVKDIIQEFCEEDKNVNVKLSEYKEYLRKYCENRLCEISTNQKDKKPKCVFKIDKEWETLRFSDLEIIKEKICVILKLNRYVLALKAVSKGCVELTYSIPKQVMEFVFPLSVAQVEELDRQGIRLSEKSFVQSGEFCPNTMHRTTRMIFCLGTVLEGICYDKQISQFKL